MNNLENNEKQNTKRIQFKPKYFIASACFALCFTFFLVVGGVIYDRDLFPNFQLLKESGNVFKLSPFIFLIMTGVTYVLFLILDGKTVPEFTFLPKWICNAFVPAGIFAVWFGIVYLSYFPGTWCYDIIEQNRMVLGIIDVTKQHPPLHTLIWTMCHLVETVSNGWLPAIVIYSILQIICMSLVLGRVVYSVWKVSRNDILMILAFLFFLLNPTFALFSFSPTKDVWCMFFFVLAAMHVFEWIFERGEMTKIGSIRTDNKTDGKEKKAIRRVWETEKNAWETDAETLARIALDLLLACLFRNNTVYGLILFGIILLFAFRNYRRETVLFGAIVLVAFLVIDKGIFGFIGFAEPDMKEMLSVPIQQIGRVYIDHGDEITAEESSQIDRYIGLENAPYYSPHISDPLKKNFNTEAVKSDPVDFLTFYLSLGGKYPDSYLIAYASLYSPYWYVRSKSFDVYSVSPYVETFITKDPDYSFERKGYLPALNEAYEKAADSSENPLLSRGIPLWITLFTLFVALALRKKRAVVIPLMCLCYMLTLFLGPLAIIRYALPILAAVPFMICGVLVRNKA